MEKSRAGRTPPTWDPIYGKGVKILVPRSIFRTTLPETNIAHEIPIFPGKYHQNGGFSMAMLVSGRVNGLPGSSL